MTQAVYIWVYLGYDLRRADLGLSKLIQVLDDKNSWNATLRFFATDLRYN
jgi:hypothetical protein